MIETKRKIYFACRKLFEKYSPKKVSIDMIVQEAEVGKGTFYNYFKNKEDVYEQIIDECINGKHSEKKLKIALEMNLEHRLMFVFMLVGKLSFQDTIIRNVFLKNKNYFVGAVNYEYLEVVHHRKLQQLFSDSCEQFDTEVLSNLMWTYLNDLVHKQKDFSEDSSMEEYSLKLASIFVKGFLSDYTTLMNTTDTSLIEKTCQDGCC